MSSRDHYSEYSKKWYRYVGEEEREAPTPDLAVDAVGVPLAVGDKVCWHIGGRHGSGHVFGVVKSIGSKGTWTHDWETITDTPEEYVSKAVNYRPVFTVEVTTPVKGRKGVTRSSNDLLHYVTPAMNAARDEWYEDSRFLYHLRAAGVDNWDGYGDATVALREELGDDG